MVGDRARTKEGRLREWRVDGIFLPSYTLTSLHTNAAERAPNFDRLLLAARAWWLKGGREGEGEREREREGCTVLTIWKRPSHHSRLADRSQAHEV